MNHSHKLFAAVFAFSLFISQNMLCMERDDVRLCVDRSDEREIILSYYELACIKRVNKFIETYDEKNPVRPRIVCLDGESISVQASEYHYCEPRIILENGDYTRVEVGYPSCEPPESWHKYAEGESYIDDLDYCDTIYAFIPIELVKEFIKKHGGIDMERLLDKRVKCQYCSRHTLLSNEVCPSCGSILS